MFDFKKIGSLALICVIAVALSIGLMHAQNIIPNGQTPVMPGSAQYFLTPISATAAVNTATTLTIPAPAASLYNYVCQLSYELNSDGTGGAASNAVTTSTNFNTFALKVSFPATVSIDSGVQQVIPQSTPAGGCPKSTSPGTATTFVSTASLTHIAWTWYAQYYQAP